MESKLHTYVIITLLLVCFIVFYMVHYMHSNEGNSTLYLKDGDINKKLYLNLISKHSETHDTQKQILSILKEFSKLPVK